MDRTWLNVWHLPFRKLYYVTHPIKLFKHIKRGFQYAHQRTHRGYCDGDVWELGSWFTDIMPQMLRDMADKGMAYPGTEPFETPEKWHEWLHTMADKLEQSTEEYQVEHDTNEYVEAFNKACEDARERANGEEVVLNTQEKIIKNKYFAREKELYEERIKQFKEVMAELVENWDCLWD